MTYDQTLTIVTVFHKNKTKRKLPPTLTYNFHFSPSDTEVHQLSKMARMTISAILLTGLSFLVATTAGEGDAALLRGGGTANNNQADQQQQQQQLELEHHTDRNLAVTNWFQMKLYYEKGMRWEERGKHWCWQCVGRKGCSPGDKLVTQPCRRRNSQEFQAVKVGGAHQFRVENELSGPSYLCMTRTDDKYRLERCDEDDDAQLFKGFDRDGKFELRPSEKTNKCVTMHHHPRYNGDYDGDAIFDQKCFKAEKTDTIYWEAKWLGSNSYVSADDEDEDDEDDEDDEGWVWGDYDCDSDNKCGRCQGDCDSDDDCKGDLKCFERYRETRWDKVPGCKGWGKMGKDYCYHPRDE